MNYSSPELWRKRGTVLLRMGRYDEALEAYDQALDLRVHDSYYYNKAVALQRLGRLVEAERALQQAIDCCGAVRKDRGRKRARGYTKKLKRIKAGKRPLIWWEWWFGQEGIRRKVLGGFLLGLLTILLLGFFVVSLWALSSLVFGWPPGRPDWKVLGDWWVWYAVPLVGIFILLLSPVIRAVGTEGIELQLMPAEVKALEPTTKPLGPLVVSLEKQNPTEGSETLRSK